MVCRCMPTTGIAHWINTHFHLSGEAAVSKNDPVVETVYNWVNEQYNEGRVTVITDDELERETLTAMKALDNGKADELSEN